MTGRLEVIGVGAMNIDHLYQVERVVTDGETSVHNHVVRLPGGSAANTIYGLAKLGIKAGFVGAVGDDAEGQILLGDFGMVGVDTSRIRVKRGVETGSVLCLTGKDSRRALYAAPGANNLLSCEDIALDYVNQAQLIHISSFIGDSQFELQKRLLTSLSPSVKVSFAPGALYIARGMSALEPLLSRAEFLFINLGEIEELTGERLEQGAGKCLERGCRVVVVTLGGGMLKDGKQYCCCIATKECDYWIESETVSTEEIVDTTGAGDAFAAGFLYGLLTGKALDECGYLGDIVAAFSIRQLGARRGLPSPAELAREYQARRHHPLNTPH